MKRNDGGESQAELMPEASAAAEPLAAAKRLSSVDVLRGVAVLGILLVNIEYFALLHADKSAAGTEWVGVYVPAALSSTKLFLWAGMRALFEGKMRAIFSMLFGASAVLLTSRLEQRGDGSRAADIYYRRTLWLLLFGVLHAYLLWEGDILYGYAVSGLVLFPFRKLSGRTLLAIGILILSVSLPRAAMVAVHREDVRALAAQADGKEAAGLELTGKEELAQSEWAEITENFQPPAQVLEEKLAEYHGGYWRLFARRAGLVVLSESSDFYGYAFFDSVGMMLLGMGLLKLRILDGSRSRRAYLAMCAFGFTIGLPLSALASYQLYFNRFDPVAVAWITAGYDPSRLAVALGHIGVVTLFVQLGRPDWLKRSLGDAGRMALTNYLGATLICTTLFNGYGFSLFGQLRRHQLYLVVLAIWCVQLAFSSYWLRHFRLGPAEWAWRSLTYWKRQPMRFSENSHEG